MTQLHRWLGAGLLSAGALCATGCIWEFRHVEVSPVERSDGPPVLAPPVKAHLLDGSTVIYRDTVRIAGGELRGQGWRYGLTLRDSAGVDVVALDSVAGLEGFRTKINQGASWAVSGVTTAAVLTFLIGTIVFFSNLPGN